MRSVRTDAVIGFAAQLVVLGVLAGTVGLSAAGWVVGVTCSLATNTALGYALARSGATMLGPANRVTLARATLIGGVAAMVTEGFVRSVSVPALLALTVTALVLDAVDGWVARRTGTTSALGARFDMEADAFLILLLSVYVAGLIGPWVLVIGAARYVLLIVGRLLPWMRGPLPPRFWRKTVAAIQSIMLTIAAANLLPAIVIITALVAALVLLAESFGRDVMWLWRHRPDGRTPAHSQTRAVVRRVTTVLSFLLVWVALVSPNQLDQLTPGAFLRIPIEGLVLLTLALVLPPRARSVLAVVVGVALGLVAVLKVLDMGFFATLDRPFDPVGDWAYFGSALGVVRDSVGEHWAVVVAVGAVLLVIGLLVFVTLSVVRLTRLTVQYRPVSGRMIAVLGVAWMVCAALGVQVAGAPVASTNAAGLAYHQVRDISASIQDQQHFTSVLEGEDPFSDTPASGLLTGLRGKDVIVAFVESYGQVAVQNSAISVPIDAELNAGSRTLRAAGFDSRSAFLTSPTFGGISWLAHSTLQSGLWIDNQQRYNQVVSSNRFTLSDAFRRAGWRTVGDVPSNSVDWPEGSSFYHYDKIYDQRNVGYAGPRFSYAAMPDQYTLAAFQRTELSAEHRVPVMAEIDLVSSHTPWAPLPRLVDWQAVGDGSVFDGMPAEGASPKVVWRHSADVKTAYGRSIQYSLQTLISFVQTFHDDNLVLVVLGDHQPATIVSGSGASHDVPITIIAHDPNVMSLISSWGWQAGMLPGPSAPVWPMDAFRNKFLTAYGPQGATSELPVYRAAH